MPKPITSDDHAAFMALVRKTRHRGKEGHWFLRRWRFKGQPAHRAAFMIFHGPIPPGHIVCHRCYPLADNHDCCNPWHLYAGTGRSNWDDHVRSAKIPWLGSHPLDKERP